MTSINAMKFDDDSGACIFDEERGWNDEGMKTTTVEKMKPVSPEVVTEAFGLVAVYGNTGTSTIGDELRLTIRHRIQKEYEKAETLAGGKPASFLTIAEVAKLAFEVITKLKHTHIDEEMEGRYGFKTRDFINASYEAGGKKVEIKDGDLVKKLDEMITWKARSREGYSVFLNSGIIAGYEPREGFRLFNLSMIEHLCEPVQQVFQADGSGRDLANVVFTEFTNSLGIPERRGDFNRVEGMMGMIAALNAAGRHDIGVGGYFNIICFDGRRKEHADKMWMINDHRAKLASEIVKAATHELIPFTAAGDLIEDLIFEGGEFGSVEESFLKKAKDAKALVRFLRGWATPGARRFCR
ncbi:MAG: hypothetical protein ACYTHM_05285 [Planctomycetota bacterium]|jgi:hypothetical protein